MRAAGRSKSIGSTRTTAISVMESTPTTTAGINSSSPVAIKTSLASKTRCAFVTI